MGIWKSSKPQSELSFLYSARKLSLPSFVITLFVTWYGFILGTGEMIFYYGIAAWIANGLIWYGVYWAYAKYFAPQIQERNISTLFELFTKEYGKWVGRGVAILTIFISSPAVYILALAVVINFFLTSFAIHIPLIFITIGISIFSIIYILFEGFRAVVRTDIVQFLFIIIGFSTLLFFSITQLGGISFILESIPSESHLSLPGNIEWTALIALGLISLMTFIDPAFYHRCFAAGPKTAQKGIYWAILFWFLFDILTLVTGLYALGLFPNENPTLGYLNLANHVLPIGIQGLFFAGILAIIMSTIDSFLFTSGVILAKSFSGIFPHKNLTILTQWGVIIAAIIAIIFIILGESMISILYALGTIVVPMLFPLFCFLLFSQYRHSQTIIITAFLTTFISTLFWLSLGTPPENGSPLYSFPYSIEPIYVGLLINTTVLFPPYLWSIICKFLK